MAGTITHFWIFRKMLEGLPDTGLVKRLKKSNEAMTKRIKYEAGSIFRSYNFNDHIGDDCLLASSGYFGATGPDLFLIPDDSFDAMGYIDGIAHSDLMHYNKTGTFVIFMLKHIKEQLPKFPLTTQWQRGKLNMMLAYCLGHISHIAADVSVHPLVNIMAAAYPTNQAQQFENSEGSNNIDLFKLHHKIEHYQDAYVRKKFFEDDVGFKAGDWECLSFPRTACLHVWTNRRWCFVVDMLEKFYKYRDDSLYGATAEQERGKLNFFYDTDVAANSSFRNYYINAIPNTKRVFTDEKDDAKQVIQPHIFEPCVAKAVALAKQMAGEAIEYMYGGKKYASSPDMYDEKKQTFKLLRKHWNFDCGIGFEFEKSPKTATFEALGAKLHVPVTMHMVARRF